MSTPLDVMTGRPLDADDARAIQRLSTVLLSVLMNQTPDPGLVGADTQRDAGVLLDALKSEVGSVTTEASLVGLASAEVRYVGWVERALDAALRNASIEDGNFVVQLQVVIYAFQVIMALAVAAVVGDDDDGDDDIIRRLNSML